MKIDTFNQDELLEAAAWENYTKLAAGNELIERNFKNKNVWEGEKFNFKPSNFLLQFYYSLSLLSVG